MCSRLLPAGADSSISTGGCSAQTSGSTLPRNSVVVCSCSTRVNPSRRASVYLGYKYHHISNADLDSTNPGLGSPMLFVGVSSSVKSSSQHSSPRLADCLRRPAFVNPPENSSRADGPPRVLGLLSCSVGEAGGLPLFQGGTDPNDSYRPPAPRGTGTL